MNHRLSFSAPLVSRSSRRKSLDTARCLGLVCLLGATSAGRAHSAGGTSLIVFTQECHELSERKEGDRSKAASLIIKSWVQGLRAQATLNAECGGQNSSLSGVFGDAEDAAWCAASIEKFLTANRDSLPDDLAAAEVLPLWWLSVHPNADAKHKEMLRTRLVALKAKKWQTTPFRRFSK